MKRIMEARGVMTGLCPGGFDIPKEIGRSHVRTWFGDLKQIPDNVSALHRQIPGNIPLGSGVIVCLGYRASVDSGAESVIRMDMYLTEQSFAKPRDADDTLNEWSHNMKSLLGLLERIDHLITKEEMMARIQPTSAK